MTGYIHSLQSLGTVDGPGLRAVVFASGCPLRCAYCHNPDTWIMKDGEPTEHTLLAKRIMKLYPYIKGGGVTFSGGEPLCQAEFFTELALELKAGGLHVAIDTSAAIFGEAQKRLIDVSDLVLLDIKMTTDEDYKRYTGGTLSTPLQLLEYCEDIGKPVWIRHVVVPGINDSEADIIALADMLRGYRCIEKTELLPFKKLCIEKYKNLGIPFPLENTPAADAEGVKRLEGIYLERIKESV